MFEILITLQIHELLPVVRALTPFSGLVLVLEPLLLVLLGRRIVVLQQNYQLLEEALVLESLLIVQLVLLLVVLQQNY